MVVGLVHYLGGFKMTRLARYKFFREHAGGIVGRSAETALSLARAEQLLEDATGEGVAVVDWSWDDEPYDSGDFYSAEQVSEKFESNEWVGPFGCVILVHGEHVASLWGIVVGPRGTDDPYCRVVAAELACEAEDDLRSALADVRDERCAAWYAADCPPVVS